jgi:uncharacterized lipoprotein YddW (UPF0748 family)
MKALTKLLVLLALSFMAIGATDSPKNPWYLRPPHGYIRGTWVTNVASDALDSRENIRKCIATCKKAGINNIYMVVWNRGYTMYQSEVMQKHFGVKIDPKYSDRDPLQEMIEEAKKAHIKVHAWFEFGFASSYGDMGKHILEKYPHWSAIGPDGKPVVKNGFTWMNGLHPEVQDFMLSLILEVVKKYKVAGIQGDDRLPACPSTIGYDPYTIKMYQQEHNGTLPPKMYNDSSWLEWRTKRLNSFGKKIYQSVKAENKKVLVSMAPSVFPWAKHEYLQDWPTWLRGGYVDYIIVQLYRYDLENYRKTLDSQVRFAGKNKNRLYAGMLSSLGNGYLAKEELISGMLRANRGENLPGEVFFYYGGIPKQEEFFKRWKVVGRRW